MNLLFANNAATTLASGINSGATTIVVATGTGAKFPDPDATEGFFVTLQDAATQLTNEIVLCTNRAGDVLTVQRGQQDTTAVSWNAGDVVAQLVTRGDLEKMIQPDQLQSQVYTATAATGTNSVTATLDSELTDLPDSLCFIMRAAAANTGPVTLTLSLDSTTLSAHSVVKYGGSALNAGDIPAAGYPCLLIWSALLGAYVLCNPASGTAGSIAGGAVNDLLVQTAPGTTGFVGAPTVAGQVLAFLGGVISWAAAAVTSFNGRSGAVAPQTGDYNAAQVGAVPTSAFQAPNLNFANPGYQALPGASGAGTGLYIQAGTRSISPNVDTFPTFPHAFPNACLSVVVSCNNQGSALNVDGFTTANFHVRVNANQISWIAIGY